MSTEKNLHLKLRRSRNSDAQAIEKLRKMFAVTPASPPSALFPWKTEAHFEMLIERSILCITAISTITGEVAGFICLDDTPHVPNIPGDKWEKVLCRGEGRGENSGKIAPYNTLWVKSVLAPPTSVFHRSMCDVDNEDDNGEAFEIQRKLLLFNYSSEEILHRLLATALTNSPSTAHLLVPFPKGCSYAVLESLSANTIPVTNCSFNGSLLHILASQVVTQLQLRLGVIEDYDDYVPKILAGDGLITALPAEFYLDELLKDQDTFHKVISAEDAKTHQVVGLMCLEASIEDQHMLSRQYVTEVFGKFLPVFDRRATAKGNADMPNVVRISFFHIDPGYALCAGQFLPFLFQAFPFVQYAVIVLPYDVDEPPFLRHFESVPLRKYQPRNSKGDAVMPPEGLWITCRSAEEPVKVAPLSTPTDLEHVMAFLDEPLSGFSPQHVAALLEDIGLRCGTDDSHSPLHNQPTAMPAALALMSFVESEDEPVIVGVASTRMTTVEEMYALRANYDLDMFINYYADEPRDYGATDVRLTAEGGQQKFFRQGARGIIVRSFYVESTYRCHIQFFLRELLRFTHSDVALVLENKDASPFAPLLRQLLRVQPRRVQEKIVQGNISGKSRSSKSVVSDKVDGKDVAALGYLFTCTRRVLGDRKKFVHSRIIVVGAGSTSLACMHRLLAVPYAYFVNIVLISTDGMPVHPNHQPHLWCTDRIELLEREHMGLIVGNPIRVIYGSVVDVDTNQRYVSIDDGTYEPYDYVILTTGRQYVVPSSICQLQQPLQQYQPRGFVPQGTIALSGESSVEKLRQHLHDLDRNPQNISNIVVYGSGLDTFAIITSMVNLGFSPQRIVVVSPEVSNPFMDNDVFESVIKMWNSLGTNILHGYHISRMEYDDDGNTLTNVVISPVPVPVSVEDGAAGATAGVSNSVELNCSLIVCCEDKDIDSYVLSTLNRRSIVFDGRVVVEVNYRTTNARVYAAGPVAMFTRRYGTTAGFDEFNARDVGENLAEVLLGVLRFEEYGVQSLEGQGGREEKMAAAQNELYTKVLEENGSRGAGYNMNIADLALDSASREAAAQKQQLLQQSLPVYNTPLAARVRLPGNYIFFCCRSVAFKPERCVRLCSSCITDNKPSVAGILEFRPAESPQMEKSGVSTPPQNLLAIYVDEQTHYIEAVVYFGNCEPEVYHYMSLVGMPQSLLNLLYRYDEALPHAAPGEEDETPNRSGLNLMEYLRLPQLQIIFYDRFRVFYRQLREKMRVHEENVNVKTRVLEQLQCDSTIDEESRKQYMEELTAQTSSFTREIQYQLIKFLHEYKDHLPQIRYLPNISSYVEQSKDTTVAR